MTMPVAIPIMLLTGGIDIHDDIIDESRKKNGRLTVYGKFGKDIALLAGDAFMFKGFTRLQLGLSQFNKDKTSKIPRILEETFFELGDAEASELALKASLQVDPEEYLRIVKKKGADVEAYTHIGAILGDGSNDEILALCKYGRILGMLAILRDDVIDAMNSAELTRRLKHEIAPLPVLYAAQTSETKSMINSILVKENRTKKDNERIVEIVNGSGGFTQTKKKMVELMDEGFKSLEPIHHRRRELKLLLNIGRTL
jgi:geranylgeranyl pyrophosphate synthase